MTNNRPINTPKGYLSRIDTSKPQIGIIKDVNDPELMGRVRVWIKGSTSPEVDPAGWIWANYASPFAGATPTEFIGRNFSDFNSTQTSYGFWATVPDIGNQVIIMFINGDIRQAYWVGCTYHKNMNYMVPGLAEGTSFDGDSGVPVAEYNKLSNNQNVRPAYPELLEGLQRQGLLGDQLRGAGTSSARRESPSKVFGILTPGGNQFIMDDGEGSELIRLRTKSGAQVLVSESVGNIYFISRDGNSWMELHNDGFVDIYGNLDISIRSEASVNIRADLDVNIEAGNSVNIKANGEGGIKLQADIANIDLSSANYYCTVSEDLNLLAKNVFVESEEESHFKNREFLVKAETNINMRGDNQLRFASDANISFTTGQNINFDGTRVDSNTGSGDLPSDADAANPATKIKSKVFLDIDFDQIGGATEENLESCVSRLPRHEPWPDHAVSPGSERISPNPEETGEEPPINASVGSVAEKAARPLPVVGSPKKGMSPGIYEPVSYEGDQPVYRNTGNQGDLIPAKDRVISPQGIEFIKKEEGFAPRKYPDGGKNRFSIGYGHQITGREPFDPEKGWTKQQATQVLTQDLEKFQAAVRKAVTAKVTQNQFDALTSFAFNVGIGALQKSTLVKKLNEGNYQEVPNEFMKWVFSEGKRNQGLIKRRRKEALLFTTP